MKFKLLLLFSIAFSILLNQTSLIWAEGAIISIEPSFQSIPQVGETFTINVSISNIENLFGYDFILWYNTTVLDCLSVEWPEGHFLTPTKNPNNIFNIETIEDNFNETTGAVRVVATLTNGEPPKNGSGLLVKITFNSTATGSSLLRLYWPGYIYPAKLSDPAGNPIPCSANTSEVIVIPEYSVLAIFLVVVTLTVTVIIIWRGRRAQLALI